MQGVLRSLAQRSRTALNMPASSHSVPHRGKKKKAGRAAAKGASSDAEDVDVDLSPYRDSMRMTVDALQRDLASIRTSGAHPSLLDNVKVEAYGTLATLASIAQVSVRDPRALLVSVFDSAMATPVERAIRSAGLNLNPSVDSGGAGRILVPVPRPTRETREAMRKTAMKEAENARVAARHVRRSAMDAIKRVKGEIPSDEFKRLEKDVQGITDEAVSTIDTAIALKLKVIDRP